MKNSILLIILLILISVSAQSQCNFKPIPNRFAKFAVSDDRPLLKTSTKIKLLFEKYNVAGRFSFVHSGDQNYFFLLIGRNNSKRWSYGTQDLLTIHLASGESVKLYPHAPYEGKKLLLNFAIGCFYKISKEEIELLTQSKVRQIEVVMDGNIDGGLNFDAPGWRTLEKGKSVYAPPITGQAKQENLINAAQCFLQAMN